MKRQRGRNRRNNNNNNNNHNRSMDSNGPDVKVRGNATQIHDKYEALARDAASSGNRVKAENYRQHAEHYLRLMNAQEAAKQAAIAAREEAEAARAEQNKSENKSDNDTSEDSQERKGRRYPPRVRQSRDKREDGDTTSEGNGLDVVTPEGEAKTSEDKPEKSTRRRKAPARKASNDDAVTEAAE